MSCPNNTDKVAGCYSKPMYQGWRNRETWIVAASIRNNEKLFKQVAAMASDHDLEILTFHHSKVERLAGRLERIFPIVQCGGVDWEAIAEMILENGEV